MFPGCRECNGAIADWAQPKTTRSVKTARRVQGRKNV